MKTSHTYLRQIVMPTLLVACFGMFMTVLVSRITEDQRQRTTDAVSREIVGRLGKTFGDAIRTLDGLKAFWLANGGATPEEFKAFASEIFPGREEIVALEWADADNVVRYVYPLEGENLKVVGLDMNKFPNRVAAILRAKELRTTVMTKPIVLVQGFPGIVIYEPVYRGDEYLGAVIGAMRASTLFAEYGKSLPYRDYDIVFGAGDRMLRPDGLAVYATGGKRVTTPEGAMVEDASAPRIDASTERRAASTVYADLPWTAYVKSRDRSLSTITVLSGLTSFAVAFLATLFLLELHRTRDALEETAARERDFTSLVSHQLRAPLTELNWMIDAAADRDASPVERSTTLADMQKIVRQSVRIITELLHISRIERGVLEVKTEETALATIIDDVLMPLREMAKARNVQFRLDVPPSLTANVDASKLVEALRNIVDNAIKYGPPSGGPVAIAARRTDGNVSITIADRGPGIPEDIRGKIFDKASAFSKKGTTDGAGLGLYLAKNLIGLMNGTIRFDTSPKGTTFTIEVPAGEKKEQEA